MFKIHHIHHFDPAVECLLERLFTALLTQGETIMNAIADYAVKQTAFNTDIIAKVADVSTQLDTLQTTITTMTTLITTLQNSPGTITPEDQATLDSLVAAGTEAQAQADALASKADTLAATKPPTLPAA